MTVAHAPHGQSLPRKEDLALLSGHGRYLADIPIPGVSEVVFVRSPYSHAKIARLETGLARESPGVRSVVTGADLDALVRPLQTDALVPGTYATPLPLLPTDRVHFAGQPVAALVAENRYLAEDAADLVEVEYQPLPAVSSIAAALAADAPQLHPQVPGNVLARFDGGSGDPDSVAAQSDIHFTVRLTSNRQAAVPMEGRACAAVPNPATGELTVYISHQSPFLVRMTIARTFGIPEGLVRVIVPDVGGAFGLKLTVYPEEMMVVCLALSLRRPVRWVEDRRENLMAGSHSREGEYEAACAADREGRLLAVKLRVASDVGAFSSYPYGAIQEPSRAVKAFPGPYALRHYRYESMAVATNKSQTGPYRGISAPVAACVMEQAMDAIAARTGLDPAEVRRRNLVPADQFPWRTAAGLTHHSGDYPALLEAALAAIDYPALRAAQPGWWADGRYVGIGLAVVTELNSPSASQYQERGTGYSPAFERVVLRTEPTGEVTVMVGTSCQGQGHTTTLAQIVAGELGLDPALVTVRFHDTAVGPIGFGAFASRTTVIAGSACILAARKLREQALEIGAHLLAANRDDVECTEGAVRVRDTERSLPLQEIFRIANLEPNLLPPHVEPGLMVTSVFSPPGTTGSGAVHAALVEVDHATSQVKVLRYVAADDCGTKVNPLIVSGQVIGAVAQGLGGALFEHLSYDSAGQLQTASLMDYLLPTAMEMPRIELLEMETPSAVPGGFKGVAEGGTIGATAALLSAVSDALRPLGIRPDRLPLSPDYLWHLMQAKRC